MKAFCCTFEGKLTNLIMRFFIDNNVHIYSLAIECAPPSYLIPNGLALTMEMKFFFGDEVTYMCNLGYVINGTGLATHKITCQVDSTWSGVEPTCEGKLVP